jgi:hypothetical protein
VCFSCNTSKCHINYCYIFRTIIVSLVFTPEIMMRPIEVCTDPWLALGPRPGTTDHVRVLAWFIFTRVSVAKAYEHTTLIHYSLSV